MHLPIETVEPTMGSTPFPKDSVEGADEYSEFSTVFTSRFPMPTPRRTVRRLIRMLLTAMVVFGYGPLITYGWSSWLLNEEQWQLAKLMYLLCTPAIGGVGGILLPLWWFRPIYRALSDWTSGQPVERARCAMVYELSLSLPWRVAVSTFLAVLIGYLIGGAEVHLLAHQPVIEVLKTIPAVPLVGGLTAAFCYFGTTRALYPVVTWCSMQLRHARAMRQVSLATKLLVTTFVLSLAMLCLVMPAAYTLGQRITEEQLADRAITHLRMVAYRAGFERFEDRFTLLGEAALGRSGYAFVIDEFGRIATPHPQAYTTIDQERFSDLDLRLNGRGGTWVDRLYKHRVVAFVRPPDTPWTLVSVTFPQDFDQPLHRFVQFSWLVLLETLIVVVVFGRYFTRSITIPLAELTQAVKTVATHDELLQHVAVTTNDELSEVARSFNRMVEALAASKTDLEVYTRRLERSTQELAAVNQEMEDLLRVVSHDLRAPLINIQGFSKRLEPIMQETVRILEDAARQEQANGARDRAETFKGDVERRFAESLRFISKSVEKMDTLLTSLLAISRIGRKADPVLLHDLNGILDDVLATFDHQLREQAIHIVRHPLPSRVFCRRNEINQVLSNLLSNAINYMGSSRERRIEIGGAEHEDRVECYVRDTGIGIRPQDHERIFQIFTRLEAVESPGEGVGLAYAKKILRSHGGRIAVASQEGQGSTFTFTLPTRPVPGPRSGT